jgi:hypothetical protein
MNKIYCQSNESDHFGNDWGFYVDIENYKYSINEYTNKIIKRNKYHDNDYGLKYDYDYDFEPKYNHNWPVLKTKIEDRGTATTSFIRITSATIITATVSFMLFYMS